MRVLLNLNLIIIITCLLVGGTVNAVEPGTEPDADLTELSLEELMGIEVTTPSKKEESLFDTPAAVYVVTGEEIRRSGVRSIPDALRIVPGVEVAQINANEWAVNIRGFNNSVANKLLVLVDGRSVYEPFFSGVFWDEVDTLLEDIDRIEVIRGPGGAIWGANAVNGVINIITKEAKDTEGIFAQGGGGNVEQGFAGLRYGGKAGENLYYRAYGKFFNRDSFENSSGGDGEDDWKSYRGGVRVDWDNKDRDAVTLKGDIYNIDANRSLTISSLFPPFEETSKIDNTATGGDVLLRWTHAFSENSNTVFQTYYDIVDRDLESLTNEKRQTFDIEFLNRFKFNFLTDHDFIWGLGYRVINEDLNGGFIFDPGQESRTDNLYSAFVQDELTLISEKLFLTIGSKFERNDFSGFEIQPNVRVLWAVNETNRLWAAVSRAVRTPSRTEHDIRFVADGFLNTDTGLPSLAVVTGNDDFDSEDLLALEMGYRTRPLNSVLIDITAFYNHYKNLETLRPGEPFIVNEPIPHLVVPLFISNGLEADGYGFEIATKWSPVDYFRLHANYSFLDLDMENDPENPEPRFRNGASPKNQIKFQSFINLPFNMELDTSLYWVDKLPALDIPSYTRLDIKLGWEPVEGVELSVVGQNLIEEHFEFSDSFLGNATRVPRSVFGALTLEFE